MSDSIELPETVKNGNKFDRLEDNPNDKDNNFNPSKDKPLIVSNLPLMYEPCIKTRFNSFASIWTIAVLTLLDVFVVTLPSGALTTDMLVAYFGPQTLDCTISS